MPFIMFNLTIVNSDVLAHLLAVSCYPNMGQLETVWGNMRHFDYF